MQYTETPIIEINDPIISSAGVRLLVKREDLNHPYVSGNKWWKLKYNIIQAVLENLPVLTFGGAYSNHIYSTAAACAGASLNSIGIIRGERIQPLNPTLGFASRHKMQLKFISRERYRNKETNQFIDELKKEFGPFFLIPEGGTNSFALKGCQEFARQKLLPIEFDYLCLPVGTGGTLAGLISGFEGERKVVGISVLKSGNFLNSDVNKLLEKFSGKVYGNWEILTSYDHGGYAKSTRPLLDFIRAMNQRHNLPLEPVYSGKLLWAVFKEIEERRFPRGSTVLALHTGGLQASAT